MRERIPHLKKATAQSWDFKSQLMLVNTGATELKSWKVFTGFQHDEILVSTEGATILNGDSFPMKVEKNGVHLTGYPQADLKTTIDTAGDLTQMSAKVKIKGTMFGSISVVTSCLQTLSSKTKALSAPKQQPKQNQCIYVARKIPSLSRKRRYSSFSPAGKPICPSYTTLYKRRKGIIKLGSPSRTTIH